MDWAITIQQADCITPVPIRDTDIVVVRIGKITRGGGYQASHLAVEIRSDRVTDGGSRIIVTHGSATVQLRLATDDSALLQGRYFVDLTVMDGADNYAEKFSGSGYMTIYPALPRASAEEESSSS